MWGFSPSDWSLLLGTVLSLVILEGLLSADNALVLAVMVRPLPKHQQKRALRYGIIGAFVFRLIAVLFAATLLDYWIFKFLGGLYLLYLAVNHLVFGDHGEAATQKPRFGSGFWGTVLSVELADIAFSIDSILAAVAMADGLPPRLSEVVLFMVPGTSFPMTVELSVVYTGGILGIITMRYVAGYFILILERFPGLANGAYWLVAWIGLKLIGGGLHNAVHPRFPAEGTWRDRLPEWSHQIPFEMEEWFFWGGMGVILVLSLLLGSRRAKPHADSVKAAVEVGQPDQG